MVPTAAPRPTVTVERMAFVEKVETDGRRLRRENSRQQVIAAMMALVREGMISPRAEDVAARSGVGLRTVFRLFNDMESLYGEMMLAIRREIDPMRSAVLTATDPDEKLVELVEKRAEIFETIAPFQRSARAIRHGSAMLQEDHARLCGMLRKSLALNIATPTDIPRPHFDALDVVMGIEVWLRFRDDMKLGVAEASQAVLAAARAILVAGRAAAAAKDDPR